VAANQSTRTKAKAQEEILEDDPRWGTARRAGASSSLSRASQLRAILLYIVRRAILHPEEPIHEFDIAYYALGRRNDFNPVDDPIVRVQMGHLRKKLDHYFSNEGKNEKLVISIAQGSYRPMFDGRTDPAPLPLEVPESKPVLDDSVASEDKRVEEPLALEPPSAVTATRRTLAGHRWKMALNVLGGFAILALACGCAILWLQNRAIHKAFYRWQDEPSVAAFWSGVLSSNPKTDVVLADPSFTMVQNLSGKSFSLSDYINRSYMGQIQYPDLSQDTRSALTRITATTLSSKGTFNMAEHILALDPLGQRIHRYYARDYTPDLFTQDNVILIGSRVSNPWDELIENRMNFTVNTDIDNRDFNHHDSIRNREPIAGEQPSYSPVWPVVAYCVVAYLPKPEHNGSILLIEGTDVEATEAAGDFLLSEEQLSAFQKELHVSKLPYFEVLLKISQVQGTPLTATVLTYRAHPNLH